jgi:hypothetical protein
VSDLIDLYLGEGTTAGLAAFLREESPPPGRPLRAALRAARGRPGASVQELAREVRRASAAKPRRGRRHLPAELREALGMTDDEFAQMIREEVAPCRS